MIAGEAGERTGVVYHVEMRIFLLGKAERSAPEVEVAIASRDELSTTLPGRIRSSMVWLW